MRSLLTALLLLAATAHAEPRHARAHADKPPLKRVLVTARALAAGDVILHDDVILALTPTPAGHGLTVDPMNLFGATLLRALKEGAIIDAGDVQLAAPLARGTPVRVRVRRGAVSVSASGILERATRPGEMTTARLSTMRMIAGRLMANHVVEVEAAGSDGDEP